MYNHKVLQIGGNVSATAIYHVSDNYWSAGPMPPDGLTQGDGPAALEPNGKVLAMLSNNSGCQFVEYDPESNSWSSVANPTNCPADPSYYGHLMMLPTGQIMFTDFSGLVEVYTPAVCDDDREREKCHSRAVADIAPVAILPSRDLESGSSDNILFGFQLNGLSQDGTYGDDVQNDTNYPLVRLKSLADETVHYAFTHDDCTPHTASCHSIARRAFSQTKFDLPDLAPGKYELVSVANGIPSESIRVTVHDRDRDRD